MTPFRSLVTATRHRPSSVAPWLRLRLHRHDAAEPWDLSDSLVSYQQADRMTAPFSSWVATLKLPTRERLLSTLAGLTDDDWAEVHVSLDGRNGTFGPLQLGPLDGARVAMRVDGEGTEEWTLVLSGRGWAKVLTDTTVSTWQRLSGTSSADSTTGSIFDPAQAGRFSNLLGQGFGDDTPDEVISGLLRFILQDQWALPPSLAQAYGTGETLVQVMWPDGHPACSTRDAEPVTGTVWRGLSMMGGVRGTLWQLLSGCQSDPALVELWPGWTREPHGREARLRPVLCYRRRPFVGDAWRYLTSSVIPLSRVVALDLGEGGFERFNVGMVSPAIAGGDLESAMLASGGDLPFALAADDPNGIRRHGTRGWFLSDSLTPPDGDLLGRTRELTGWLRDAYLGTPDLLNGSLAVAGLALPPTVLGQKALLTDGQGAGLLEFYCEGLDTKFEVGSRGECTLRQTLSVTRGQRPEATAGEAG